MVTASSVRDTKAVHPSTGESAKKNTEMAKDKAPSPTTDQVQLGTNRGAGFIKAPEPLENTMTLTGRFYPGKNPYAPDLK